MQWFFIFFVISGFCSLVYQIAWLRLAMAGFGVTTTSVSLFLSIFMAGMALGSWGGGKLASRYASSPHLPLRLYAGAEACIALSGIIVVPALDLFHSVALNVNGASWLSYLVSAFFMAVALLPFCACMGATFPLAIAAARRFFTGRYASSFSYLYVGNVLGAMLGALSCAFVMIELLGFKGTMAVAVALNLLVAGGALILSFRGASGSPTGCLDQERVHTATADSREWKLYGILFLTGFASLGMEVVWTRLYIPVFGPLVYTFAFILAAYLLATLIGSQLYRYYRKRGFEFTDASMAVLLAVITAAALLPLLATDPRLSFLGGPVVGVLRMLAGIGPFCALLGFLTPALVDRVSSGDPDKVGTGYALNMLGCIIGPLVIGFLLNPILSEKWALIALAAPLSLSGYLFSASGKGLSGSMLLLKRGAFAFTVLVVVAARSPEDFLLGGIVKRDHTATVIATGEGMAKLLLVNGYGMTALTPITKMMVHLPMAFHDGPINKGIVLCFGMGTSYRSMLAWGVSSTVVELVPSIPGLVPFYHQDGELLLNAPNGRIVIDDARRFLERTQEQFDVVVVDPPPPVEAAASSLLYSKEFYGVVRKRLSPGGIFQQWIPLGPGGGTNDTFVIAAMMKSIAQSFPYVRTFYSNGGDYGIHVLASMKPIPERSPDQLAASLPARAAIDIVEWGPHSFSADQFREVLLQEEPVEKFIAANPSAPALTDDRPVNEYYILRTMFRTVR